MKGYAPSAPGVRTLIERAYAAPWNPFDALPWELAVDAGRLALPEGASVVADTAAYRKLAKRQREKVKRLELVSHLSSLAYGEHKATILAGQTAELSPEQRPEELWFLGTLMADEGKHFEALARYLDNKLDSSYPPHRALPPIFEALSQERDYELNLYVGQVLLEGAAASLLSALLLNIREPLLHGILRKITLDEARHMKFADLAMRTKAEQLSPARRKRMEEILFEGAVAGASCLLAEEAWREAGLALKDVRQGAVEALKKRGVLPFYTRILGQQLVRRGFPAATLQRKLETRLTERLRTGR